MSLKARLNTAQYFAAGLQDSTSNIKMLTNLYQIVDTFM